MKAHEYTGIDHVQLAAPDGCEKEARAFYGELLGMREIPKPVLLQARGGVWFGCGPHEVHIGADRLRSCVESASGFSGQGYRKA
ncbi:hypothetical protein SAMN04487970_103113 [Paenibacillus tianmuensis]|uniref:Glyoxalase n=1 Tax=Paenibacillus tianmuensis TaxID=624147 RepID=A0A1G4SMN0_9BACL|nr:hypothetical protein SAMN04487970_103113 [Paenibacillus tianmuensis]